MARLVGQSVTRYAATAGGATLNLSAFIVVQNQDPGGMGILEGQLQLQSDGDLLATQFGFLQGILDNWVLQGDKPITNGGDYECRLERTSGTNPSGLALNTWYALSSFRTWTWSQVGFGILNFQGTIKVREVGNAASEVSGGVSVNLENGV